MDVKYTSFSLRKRLLALIVLVIFFLALLVGRLFYLQVICGRSLQARAMSQWLRDLPTKAIRGTITDRNGVVLASSVTTYDVYVRPNDVKDVDAVVGVLARVCELDREKLREKVTKRGLSEVRITNNISQAQMQAILNDYADGIFFSQTSTRNYAYDDLLTQVLGFVNADGDGQAGLEAFYNKYLKGVAGVSLVESDIKGKTLDNSSTYYIDPIDGLNLTLTIDFQIQKAVEEIMQNCYLTNGAKAATAVVLNPQTGEVVAMTTKPSFDLNNIPRDDVSALMQMAKNVAVSDAYEPGSTFKVLTTAMAMNEGLASANSYFYCGGCRIVDGVKINCHRRTGHGSQSMYQGLSNSCNCVFMELASRLGVNTFYDYCTRFGLTTGFGVDIGGEGKAVTMPKSMVKNGDLYRMGFGQAIAVTPLGLTNAVGAVVNGGTLMQPYFVKNITSNAGNTLYTKTPTSLRQVIKPDVSKTIATMLEEVVSTGGGKRAKVPGYSIGGKTGTAQKYENGAIAQGKYVASFIGFTPAESPEYIVLVTVDEPKGAYYGGVVAAPVAREIFEKIFEIRGTEASDRLEAERRELEANIKLPSFIGKTLTEAASEITAMGLRYLTSGEGRVVTAQLGTPGTMVFSGDTVLLIMD